MRLDLNDYQWLTEQVGNIQGVTQWINVNNNLDGLDHNVLSALSEANRVLVEFRCATDVSSEHLSNVLDQIHISVPDTCEVIIANDDDSDIECGYVYLNCLTHAERKRSSTDVRQADHLAYDADNNIMIWPLTPKHLDDAISLRDLVFEDLNDDEYRSLEASINKDDNRQWYRDANILWLNYWVAVDENTQKIVGLVGLYDEECYPEPTKTWLGWFCVDPEYRGIGLGERLLEYAIELAKEVGKKSVYIYTTSDEEYAAARALYEKSGFDQYETEGEVLYYKLKIKEKYNAGE